MARCKLCGNDDSTHVSGECRFIAEPKSSFRKRRPLFRRPKGIRLLGAYLLVVSVLYLLGLFQDKFDPMSPAWLAIAALAAAIALAAWIFL